MKTMRLKIYSFMLACVLAFMLEVNAQVFYTDVVPDSTVQCTTVGYLEYGLDLNMDKAVDFMIKQTEGGYFRNVGVQGLGDNEVLSVMIPFNAFAALDLDYNYMIDSTCSLSTVTKGFDAIN